MAHDSFPQGSLNVASTPLQWTHGMNLEQLADRLDSSHCAGAST